ncbi:MAG: helix-hairpin-helix domain-containing protein [Anaerolineales bacterium]
MVEVEARRREDRVLCAEGGQPHELVKMAAENATETLTALRAQWQADTHKQEQALTELQQALNLKEPPNRIECYDISNTQGTAIIGAMVVFTQGVADKKLYRKFNIESVVGAPDDFASMEEMLTRRFRRWRSAEESATQVGAKKDASFSFLPDLVIIDGGKGQLSRAVEVLEKFELMGKIPIVNRKKRFSRALHSRFADVAASFASLISGSAHSRRGASLRDHRASQKRQKLGMASILDSIPGIGPARRKALLKHFGSVDKIRTASLEELQSVVPDDAAQSIKANLE